MPLEINDGVPVEPSACVIYSDVLDYLNVCNAPELCATQAKVEENLETAIEFIQSITDTKFCPYTACKTLKGTDDCRVFWNFRDSDALISVTTVSLNGTELSDEAYELNDFSIKILNNKVFKCSDKIEICGLWGVVMPANVKKAIIMLALEYSQAGILGIQQVDTGVEKVMWSDFSIEYAGVSSDVLTTGYKEIDRLIASFVPTIKFINFSVVGNKCPNCCKDRCQC